MELGSSGTHFPNPTDSWVQLVFAETPWLSYKDIALLPVDISDTLCYIYESKGLKADDLV